LVARRTFLEIDGISQPAPAPRFARTPAPIPGRERFSSTDESMAEVNRILGTLGYSEAEVGMLRKERAVR
jgi:alpha-methylacyl-CoA racemase